MRRFSVIALCACCIGIQANASLALYEGFEYTIGSEIIGQGAVADGWNGAWVGTTTVATGVPTVMDGLSEGTIYAPGGSFQRATKYGVAELTREISGAAQTALTADNSTVWFSVLMDPRDASVPSNIQNTWTTLVLGDAGFSTAAPSGSYAPMIISGTGNAVGLSFKSGTSWDAMAIQGVAYTNGVNFVGGNVTVGDTLSMIVGQIDWAADGSDDTVSLYDITDPSAPLPTAFSVQTVDLDQSTFNMVALGDGQAAMIDEIKFGTELVDVIPEPATLGLVAVFGGAVLFVRRRFMV